MPILAGLLLLIQFSFALLALKTGRPYWWIFIIMGFPVMGCLIYYFVEVFPNSREHRKVNKAARNLAKVLQRDVDLKRRAEELEICGRIDNKMALALECMGSRMHAEAYSVLEGRGENNAALAAYRDLVPVFVGLRLEASYTIPAMNPEPSFVARPGLRRPSRPTFGNLATSISASA
jgi:hypothetical protein